MRLSNKSFVLTATDLVGYLNCRHLSDLDRAVAEGKQAKPKAWNPLLEVLWERGSIHEQAYVDHLKAKGLEAVRIEGVEVTPEVVAATIEAMQKGVPVIIQAALANSNWSGRADILMRVEGKSLFGNWAYEPVDTKLARETKAGAILQLCVYADLLRQTQGAAPEFMHVVAPWTDFQPYHYRYTDHAAYYRRVQRGLEASLLQPPDAANYPDPKDHCEVCRWWDTCEKRRRDDDHLCLVAGISKVQINELNARNIDTAEKLAAMPLPLDWKPERGSAQTYARIREQARIQVEARHSGVGTFELLPVEPGFGFTRLPAPSDGDIYLDLEGDPFVGEHGLEYLFGYVAKEATGQWAYHPIWSFTRADEKQAFERFIDFVMARWQKYPDLHIYHYTPYEPGALKRVMGRYATREEDLDHMLRTLLFVDLYQIVRHALRASVESYSIKSIEPFFKFERKTALSDAKSALARLEAHLELGDVPAITEEVKSIVAGYNEEDCHSARALRDWLEELRAKQIADGADIPRPETGDGAPNEKITAWLIKIEALVKALTSDIPANAGERTPPENGKWLLAHILDFHRRELKATWWEFFRLKALSVEDLFDEKAGISGLVFVKEVGGTAKAPIHRYRFPAQETDVRGRKDLHQTGGDAYGSVVTISLEDRTIDIKKRKDTADVHSVAVYEHEVFNKQVQADSLVRIAEHVVKSSLIGAGPFQAARDLLLREAPRIAGQCLQLDGETPLGAALRLCGHLEAGVLPIQGPPGAGKTYVGANMVVELAHRGKTVGVTANSHKVIRNLLDGVIKAAEARKILVQCAHKTDTVEDPKPNLTFPKKNEDLLGALGGAIKVGGGTSWLWSRSDASDTLDVLFVDEAAQMSLADVLAVSPSAKTVVLIGDPQQLDQPVQGSHPDGTEASALAHILGEHQTIPPNRGLFLAETWRLHPDICAFTSELFYEGKLQSRAGLDKICVKGGAPLSGAGLVYLPVAHAGNQNCAPQEAAAIKTLVERVLADKPSWINREGNERVLTLDDIVIITPYNAQVFEIQRQIPGACVGTVDKFQGQEAPIAIYSTATSSHADAPRGMEFLYSLNRLNVATSRAKCVCVLVSSPAIFEAECKTPRQIQLANAFCRYLEIARPITL
jgi:predicted RecB family nuclease